MKEEPTILLLNRALAYNAQGKVTGWSGVEYGQSVYEEAFGAHVCRLPLAQWRACKDDVTRGAVRRFSQWEVDLELPDAPAGGAEVIERIRQAGAAQFAAIVAGLSPLVQAVHQRTRELSGGAGAGSEGVEELAPAAGAGETTSAAPVAAASPAPRHTVESLAGITNYRALLRLAREAGIENAEAIDHTAALREAILAKQGGLQTA